MNWKNNSYTYYRWWFENVGFNYLTLDQKILAVHNLESADDQWWVAASKKALAQRTPDDRQESNTLARIMGRNGEQQVVDYLLSKGWIIHTRPCDNLRPEFGTSTSGYDIVATHGVTTIKIEVKSMRESSPLWTLGTKCYASMIRTKTDYLVIVKGDQIAFVAIKDIKFDEPVYVHDGLKYEKTHAFKYLLTINPCCLNIVARKRLSDEKVAP